MLNSAGRNARNIYTLINNLSADTLRFRNKCWNYNPWRKTTGANFENQNVGRSWFKANKTSLFISTLKGASRAAAKEVAN